LTNTFWFVNFTSILHQGKVSRQCSIIKTHVPKWIAILRKISALNGVLNS
jgi:hypothetical protein